MKGQLNTNDFAKRENHSVKPLGTITACFPHVDPDTKSTLESIMHEAKDYNDFADRLSERAIKDSVLPLVNFFAYFHAYNQNRYNLVRKIIEEDTVSELVRPFALMIQPQDSTDWVEFQKAIISAIKAAPNDWIGCHIYLTWRGLMESASYYPEKDTDLKPLRILESKIENDEMFSYFSHHLHLYNAWKMMAEGNTESATKSYNRAITLAKKHDDLESVAILLTDKANIIKWSNFQEALSILKISREISEQLGYTYGLALNERILGLIAQARGEYEKAIEYLTEFATSAESLGHDIVFHKCVIGRNYNLMNDGRKALELTTEALEETSSPSPCFPYIQNAWALLILDRLEEAMISLDKAREPAMKSGVEWLLGQIYFLEGLIHHKQDDLASAKYALEQAHSISERQIGFSNLTLLKLADVEIETYSYKEENADNDVSGPWLKQLLDHVQQKDVPGIAAQAILLKAKFRFKQGHTMEAKKLLQRVLRTSDTSGMHYLRNMAELMFPDLMISGR